MEGWVLSILGFNLNENERFIKVFPHWPFPRTIYTGVYGRG